MNNPLVSVAMVVCNVERFLPEAIESILAQTFRDFEFIIVDFGSTDNSKSIIASYAAKDDRIKFHEMPPSNLGAVRNEACSRATGKYVAIMDADDIAVPDRLRLETAFLEANPRVGVLGGATEWIDTQGRSLRIDELPSGDQEIREALTVRCPFCQPSVMIRKEAFDLAGGYRPVFLQAEDYDLWLRISERFECANLKDVVLKYRIHPYQVSMRKREQQTLCVLAAQASAAARKSGNSDSLGTVREIAPDLLRSFGVSEARQQNVLVADRRQWIRHMCMAGEYSVALSAALEILHSGLKHVESWQIADLQLTVGRLYWRSGKLSSCLVSSLRAIATRPAVVLRPLKPLLSRLGIASSTKVQQPDWNFSSADRP